MHAISERPQISVVMPTRDTEPRHLRAAIGSLRAQEYSNWELWIVDDGSTRGSTRRAIRRWASRDERINARLLERSSGISAASNEGLSLCRGELVAFLDHDDTITPDALQSVARAFSERQIDVLYTDQDKLTATGEPADPFHKPDWSPTYALGAMYVGHLLVARRELVEEARGFDPAFDTIQDFELLLRLSERTHRIHHIPRVLYHWRAIPGSIALAASEKGGVGELQARAVNEHLRRRDIAAEAVPHETIPHRVRLRPLPRRDWPKVTVVIPAREGAERALRAVRERTTYPALEVLVEEAAGSFHPGGLANAGASRADGDYLVFLGEDTEVTEPEWIERLLLYAEMPGVGAVAPTVTRPDGSVDAAGIALGLYDPATPVMRGSPADGDGYYGSLSCAREVSAVGMECMLLPRSVFEELGGFEQAYRRQFHDFDLCMRIGRRGLTVVCTPDPPTVTHTTDARRRADFDVIDRALFVDRWYDELARGDPYYNPSFFPAAADYAVSPFRADPLELAIRETVG
jgi:glycosyltransferase involved in cell wall biosynthesis